MTARVVDLGRVRRTLARLDRTVAEHPELATPEARARLDTWIGDDPCPHVRAPGSMPEMGNPTLTARMDPAVVARVEACAEAMNARAEPGAPQMDRGAIVRLLVMRGLPAMEAELGIAAAQKGGKRPPRKA